MKITTTALIAATLLALPTAGYAQNIASVPAGGKFAEQFAGKTWDGYVNLTGGKLILSVESVLPTPANEPLRVNGSYGWLTGERGPLKTVTWDAVKQQYTIVFGSTSTAKLIVGPPDAKGVVKGTSCVRNCTDVTFTPKQ